MAPTASDPQQDLKDFRPPRAPRLYFDADSTHAAEILSELAIDRIDSPREADLLWLRTKPEAWYPHLSPFQAINHIPHETAMVRKADLAGNLHAYAASQPANAYSHRDFLPETYRLNDADERAAFLAQLPREDNPGNLWILKPSDLSEGQGIRILWELGDLRKTLERPGGVTFRYNGKPHEYIIQRYIKDVLLLDGRKSDYRIYWLIASLDPLLVLVYPEVTARLNLEPYKLDDFSNPLIHLTNEGLQKKYGGERANVELRWDPARLQAYLSGEKGAPDNFVSEVLPARVTKCLEYVVRTCIGKLRQTPRSGLFFGLYGADFIIDEGLRPWLNEIQKGPGLSYSDPVKARILPGMLKGAARIVLEVLAKKRAGQPLLPLSSTHGFLWVIP